MTVSEYKKKEWKNFKEFYNAVKNGEIKENNLKITIGQEGDSDFHERIELGYMSHEIKNHSDCHSMDDLYKFVFPDAEVDWHDLDRYNEE